MRVTYDWECILQGESIQFHKEDRISTLNLALIGG